MSYETAVAFRMALETRLSATAEDSGLPLDRLRRRVLLERIVARLQHGMPGRWVVKGGMALEVRLGSSARLTKDLDLGARIDDSDELGIRDLLVETFALDPFEDRFVLRVGRVQRLTATGHPGILRTAVDAHLAGKPFGRIKLDISLRVDELLRTEHLTMPNTLAFADIPDVTAEVVDLHRHAAEKLHALTRRFKDRENTRVRDLVDLTILMEQHALDPQTLGESVREVWAQRDGTAPPGVIEVPQSWHDRFEKMAHENDLMTTGFGDAVTAVMALWDRLDPPDEEHDTTW